MKCRLAELAEVRLGYQARGRVEPDPHGSHRIIQFKDIDNLEGLKIDDLYTIVPERDVESCLVLEGDVLFLSRGNRNIACTVTAALDYTIAAGNLYVIRPFQQRVLPEYLAWHINQPATQAVLKEMARGVTIQTIPKSAFETLQVYIPPLDVQHKVAHLAVLHRREQVLTRRLMEKREQLVQEICQKAVKRELSKEGK